MTRRELLAMAASAAVLRGANSPAPPVAIARASYGDDLAATLNTMFDQLGGAARIVRNRTVTLKLNLTGSPSQRFQGRALGLTHYTHPKTAMAMAHVLEIGRASCRE